MISFVLLLLAVFGARTILERANKHLDQEKKAQLIDLFSRNRIYNFALLVGLILLYFLSLEMAWFDPFISYVAFSLALVLFLIGTAFISYKRLSDHDFPYPYIRAYIGSTSLRFLGLVVFVVLYLSR